MQMAQSKARSANAVMSFLQVPYETRCLVAVLMSAHDAEDRFWALLICGFVMICQELGLIAV